MNKELWVATWVEMEGIDLRSFGNLNGRIYTSREDAWNACLDEMGATKKNYPNAQTDIFEDGNHCELWDDNEDVKFVWEIQRMDLDGDEGSALSADITDADLTKMYEDERKRA